MISIIALQYQYKIPTCLQDTVGSHSYQDNLGKSLHQNDCISAKGAEEHKEKLKILDD